MIGKILRLEAIIFKFGLILPVLQFQAAVFEGTPYRGQQLLAIERLEQVIIGPIANRIQRDRNIVHGGNHDDGNIRKAFFGSCQQSLAVHNRHHHVRQHEFEFFAGLKQGQSLSPRLRLGANKA